jgi:GAF domain-containing protein
LDKLSTEEVLNRLSDLNGSERQKELQKLLNQLKAARKLLQVNQQMQKGLDFESAIENIITSAYYIVDADRCSLFLCDHENQELTIHISREATNIKIPLDSGICGYVARTGKMENIPDAYADDRFCSDVDRETGYRTRSILCCPLMNNRTGKTAAVIQVLNKRTRSSIENYSRGKMKANLSDNENDPSFGEFSADDESMLMALAAQASVFLECLRLAKEKDEQQAANTSLQAAVKELQTNLELQTHLDAAEKLGSEMVEATEDATASLLVTRKRQKSIDIPLQSVVRQLGSLLGDGDAQAEQTSVIRECLRLLAMPDLYTPTCMQPASRYRSDLDTQALGATQFTGSLLSERTMSIQSDASSLSSTAREYLQLSGGQFHRSSKSTTTPSGLSKVTSAAVSAMTSANASVTASANASAAVSTSNSHANLHPRELDGDNERGDDGDYAAYHAGSAAGFKMKNSPRKAPLVAIHGAYSGTRTSSIVSRSSSTATRSSSVDSAMGVGNAADNGNASVSTSGNSSRKNSVARETLGGEESVNFNAFLDAVCRDPSRHDKETKQLLHKAVANLLSDQTQQNVKGKDKCKDRGSRRLIERPKADWAKGWTSGTSETKERVGQAAKPLELKRGATGEGEEMVGPVPTPHWVDREERTLCREHHALMTAAPDLTFSAECVVDDEGGANGSLDQGVGRGVGSMGMNVGSEWLMDWDLNLLQLENHTLYELASGNDENLQTDVAASRPGPHAHSESGQFRGLNGLQQVCFLLLEKAGLVAAFAIPETPLRTLLQSVCTNYLATNPYHNFYHATSTMHVSFLLLATTSLGIGGARSTEGVLQAPSQPLQVLSPLAQLALLLGAVCHDVGHRGFNNSFEVATDSELAILYNDQSVLENHHCATAFRILLQRKRGGSSGDGDANSWVLQHLERWERRELRRLMVKAIISTDMAGHFELLARFRLRSATDSSVPDKASNHGRHPGLEDTELLACMLLHSADLSNPIRGLQHCRQWQRRVAAEFQKQALAEAALGLPVSALMNGSIDDAPLQAHRELGFIDHIVAPQWDAMREVLPELGHCLQRLGENRNAYLLDCPPAQ